MKRVDGRAPSETRTVKIQTDVNPYAEGSAEVRFGNTVVLVTASVEDSVPEFLRDKGEGWITSEYGMLPRSTHTRNKREAASGKQSGRTLEIQRLIGRALRQAVDLRELGPKTVRIDCDVIVADGGTRTASITGGWVALAQALRKLKLDNALRSQIVAVSVGRVAGALVVDLNYEEDSQAEFDLNLVFNQNGEVIEIQGTAERSPLKTTELTALLSTGWNAAEQMLAYQRSICG